MVNLNFENGEGSREEQIMRSIGICLSILNNDEADRSRVSSLHYFRFNRGDLLDRTVSAIPRENGLKDEEKTSIELTLDPEERLNLQILNHTGTIVQIHFSEGGVVAFRPALRGGYELRCEGGQLKRSWGNKDIEPVTQIDHQFWNNVVLPIRDCVIENMGWEEKRT